VVTSAIAARTFDLDGQDLVIGQEGGYWVRFVVTHVVTHVPVALEKPHGIDDASSLHGRDGVRPVGFDSAHPVARQRHGDPPDHRHRLRMIRACEYRDAANLPATRPRWRQCARQAAR